MITASLPTLVARPTVQEWNNLIKPGPGEEDKVVLGRRSEEPLPTSIAQVRQQVAALDYLPIDPFVASVAASISSDQTEVPKGEKEIKISLPEFYKDDVKAQIGLQNGPGAPMLVILPGINSSGETSHNCLLKKLALERGMNYIDFPNSLSEEKLDEHPVNHPGNPRVDALWVRQALTQLKEQAPGYFDTVSVVGYSYGALQGANLVRLDEEHGSERLINGGLVAFSPPENLEHSMRQLDGLRLYYEDAGGTIADTGLKYKHDVKKYGYDGFMQTSLASHGQGTNIDEIDIADTYGSRDGLKKMIEKVDEQFDHKLPMNTEEYKHANPIKKLKMRDEHNKIVDNITYQQFSDGWMTQDDWLHQQGLTPEQMADKYSFSHALQTISHTPVLMMASKDDYILNPSDVQQHTSLETHHGPLEIARMFDRGGHVGLDFNPQVGETAIDFAMAAPKLKG